MLNVRGEQPAFDPYGNAEFDCQGSVFIIKRSEGDQQLFALHNFSADPVTAEGIPEASIDLLTGDAMTGPSCQLQPFEFRWLK